MDASGRPIPDSTALQLIAAQRGTGAVTISISVTDPGAPTQVVTVPTVLT